MTYNNSTSIGLCDPKSPSNVGAVLRAAGCYGISTIYYTGVRFSRAATYHQDTKNVNEKVALTCVGSFKNLIEKDQYLVCVELVEGATSLPDFIHPDNALYIFGPEDGSIEQSLIDAADEVVYIPTIGCMNLAATVNVLLYDRMAKQEGEVNHSEVVRASRDVNNRLTKKISKVHTE